MKKYLYKVVFLNAIPVLVLLSFLFINTQAQTYNGNLALTTQAEVDSFNYSSVTGILEIQGSGITNLDGLSELITVGGHFVIHNCESLTDIIGLSNLKAAYGAFSILNTGLTNLDPLSNLDSTAKDLNSGGLFILYNDFLTNINGLSNLSFIGEDLFIIENNVLPNIDPLSGIFGTIVHCQITDNAALENIEGIANITQINENIQIIRNPVLRNINGLKATIGGSIFIHGNSSLKDLNALSHLSAINGFVSIIDNSLLEEFCGLYGIVSHGIEDQFFIMCGNKVNPRQQEILDNGPCEEKASVTAVSDFLKLPTEYNLSQNYPNPFNPNTVIRFSLPEAAFVKLSVYNSLGELVKALVSETKDAGYYEISFDATSLSSGMYIYKIEAGSFVQSSKMILLK